MGLRAACRISGQPEIAFDFLRKKYLSMSFSPALIYDFLFLAIFSFAAVKSWQKGFLAGLTELVGAVLGVGVAVWGSRTLAPEVYTRFFSDSVTARVNEAVAQSGGDIAAALQQLDFLPESLRNTAANALQTAGDQLPEKLTALLEPLFLPLVQVVLFVLLCLCIMAGSVGGVLLSMYIVQVTADDAETLDLDNQKNRQTSIVYDINGNEYASLSRNENRIWRELSAMPENLQNAVIAIEDKNFRTEPGINLKGTIGAALNAFTGNRIWGTNRGASTLEQQLIKNLTGDNEQDNMRKVREIFRALGLDNKYSKETILEAYLNTIPLTGIIHGMEAGSLEYFGKHVEDLTLAECATLASITKNPTKYNPATNPEELIKRRNHVLYEMYTQGYITEAEFNAAKAETVTLTEKTSTTENATRSSSNSWFTDALYTQLLSQLQEDLNYTADEAKELIFSGGLRIYSTVDPTVQAGIEKTMYNEDDLIPALWHEEPVCLRDYPADSSSWDEVQYDEATGLPITKDGYAVYGQEAIPVYADDEGTTLKTGTSTDPDYPNDTTVYLCVYEKVRTQAAMATLDYDGNILGIGGGIGEKKYDLGFNRATSPHQTGSTMKPIGAYALALDYKLINYSSQILDSPYYLAEDKKVLKDQYIGVMSPFSEAAQSRSDVWRAWPTNYGGAGGQGNPMLVYDALQQSYNTVAVWVGDMVGVDYLYNFVHDTLECSYISAENDMDLGPLVLGSQSSGLTVVQLAGAYTMFNTGTFTTPHYYTEITDYQGNMILDNNKYINTTQAISADTAYIMNRMMWNVLHSRKGTAYGKAPDGEMDSVAKTGTTSNYKDYTFAGLTPYYVTAIWWGCDRPTEMDMLIEAAVAEINKQLKKKEGAENGKD